MGHPLRNSRVALKQWEGPERLTAAHNVMDASGQASEEVHQGARFMHVALGTIRDLVAVCDNYGRVTMINRAMELFAGIDPGGLLPEPWSAYGEMFHLDGEPVTDGTGPMARALRGETVRDVEMVMVGKSGRRRTMTVDGEPLFDVAGEPLQSNGAHAAGL